MFVYKLSVVIRKKTHKDMHREFICNKACGETFNCTKKQTKTFNCSKKQTQILAMKLPVVIRKNNNTKT